MTQSQSQARVLKLQSLQILLIQLAAKMTMRWTSMTAMKPSQRHKSRSKHLKRVAIPKAELPTRSQGSNKKPRPRYLPQLRGSRLDPFDCRHEPHNVINILTYPQSYRTPSAGTHRTKSSRHIYIYKGSDWVCNGSHWSSPPPKRQNRAATIARMKMTVNTTKTAKRRSLSSTGRFGDRC